jgi:DNA-binding IclR family transcriptional regulator
MMQGVQRAVAILEFLAAQDTPSGPSEIARSVGLSKPTVVRVLRTWQMLGYVSGNNGSYELGWKIYTLTNARSQAGEIQTAAKRYLTSLNEQSGETVHLAVVSELCVTYVDKLDGRRNIRVHGEIGRTAPIHATGTGKAILAYASQELLDQVLAQPLEAWTPRTKSTADELMSDLEATRLRGYSINRGEWHADVCGVGAPILNHAGETEGSLGISFPIAASDEDRVHELGELVRVAAQQLSRERGWLPPP